MGWRLVVLAAATCAAGTANAKDKDGHVAVGLAVPDFSFDIERKDPPDGTVANESLSYSPNIPLAATVEVSAYGFTVGTSFDIDGSSDSDEATDAKAKTNYSSYDLSYFFNRIGFEAAYTDLKGMNITSATGFDGQELNTDREAHRPDIQLTSTSADIWLAPLAYNFSLSDFFDPASRSHGSGLALIGIAAYDDMQGKARQPLIPAKFSKPYGEDANVMGGHFTAMTGQLGPAFVLDFKGLYVSGLFTYGEGNQMAVYHRDHEGDITATHTSVRLNYDAAVGYKGDSIFTSITFAAETPIYDLNTITISTTRSLLSWIIGMRF